MKYVYLLRSISHPNQRYIGLTEDISARLAAHNSGNSIHTARYRPWEIFTIIQFEDDDKAQAFERYLKTGSGWEFANCQYVLCLYPLMIEWLVLCGFGFEC